MFLTNLPLEWKKRIAQIPMTQNEFAFRAGVSYSALSNALNKRGNPTLFFADKVEKTLSLLEQEKSKEAKCNSLSK